MARQVRDVGGLPLNSIGILVRPHDFKPALGALHAGGWTGEDQRSRRELTRSRHAVHLVKGRH